MTTAMNTAELLSSLNCISFIWWIIYDKFSLQQRILTKCFGHRRRVAVLHLKDSNDLCYQRRATSEMEYVGAVQRAPKL